MTKFFELVLAGAFGNFVAAKYTPGNLLVVGIITIFLMGFIALIAPRVSKVLGGW